MDETYDSDASSVLMNTMEAMHESNHTCLRCHVGESEHVQVCQILLFDNFKKKLRRLKNNRIKFTVDSIFVPSYQVIRIP